MEELSGFDKVAPYLTHPLALIGFVLLAVFSIHKALIQSGIIPPVGPRVGGRLLQSLLRYGFVIALVVIVLGFALQFYKTQKLPEEPTIRVRQGVGAGGNIANSRIRIAAPPADPAASGPAPGTGVAVQSGVGAGGNIEGSRIDISTAGAIPERSGDPSGR